MFEELLTVVWVVPYLKAYSDIWQENVYAHKFALWNFSA